MLLQNKIVVTKKSGMWWISIFGQRFHICIIFLLESVTYIHHKHTSHLFLVCVSIITQYLKIRTRIIDATDIQYAYVSVSSHKRGYNVNRFVFWKCHFMRKFIMSTNKPSHDLAIFVRHTTNDGYVTVLLCQNTDICTYYIHALCIKSQWIYHLSVFFQEFGSNIKDYWIIQIQGFVEYHF